MVSLESLNTMEVEIKADKIAEKPARTK